MSISRQMDKNAVVCVCVCVCVYIYILEYYLAIKKEHTWVSSNEVDETGAYYTEWNKSEREIPIQYINIYIWKLERW